jgi:hypothetical protein
MLHFMQFLTHPFTISSDSPFKIVVYEVHPIDLCNRTWGNRVIIRRDLPLEVLTVQCLYVKQYTIFLILFAGFWAEYAEII